MWKVQQSINCCRIFAQDCKQSTKICCILNRIAATIGAFTPLVALEKVKKRIFFVYRFTGESSVSCVSF